MTGLKFASLVGGALSVAMALPAPAAAETAGARITLTVPEVCQIETSAILVDAEAGSASGSVFEMCNSGRGFRVLASHRALAEGEQVQIDYAGEIRQLDRSGISAVAQRSGPTIGHVPVRILTDGLVGNLAISLGLAII